MNKKFLLIAILMFASITGFSQAQFSLYGGGVFPMGNLKAGELRDGLPTKWALIKGGDKGYAGVGFNVGMDIMFPINSVDGLGITLGADFLYNSYNSELKDFISDFIDAGEEEYESFSLKKPRIMNVPIMLGARYLFEINDGFGIFAEAGLGVNMRFISKFEMSCEYEASYSTWTYNVEETYTYKYKNAVTFAFKAGAGMMLGENFSIGVDFYALGSANVKANVIYNYSNDDPYDPLEYKGEGKYKSKALSCSELVLRLGYHF